VLKNMDFYNICVVYLQYSDSPDLLSFYYMILILTSETIYLRNGRIILVELEPQ
jgi:hypothetical protein